jgi:hypothetical protein
MGLRAPLGLAQARASSIESGDAMSQTVAIVLPLPVVLALVVLLFVLLVLSAVVLSMNASAPVRFPSPPGEQGGQTEALAAGRNSA